MYTLYEKKIYKSFKFRLYPTKEQEILLSKHFGACRFVFNHYLNERKENILMNYHYIFSVVVVHRNS
jgi:transposase